MKTAPVEILMRWEDKRERREMQRRKRRRRKRRVTGIVWEAVAARTWWGMERKERERRKRKRRKSNSRRGGLDVLRNRKKCPQYHEPVACRVRKKVLVKLCILF
jgi:hypothetical protein